MPITYPAEYWTGGPFGDKIYHWTGSVWEAQTLPVSCVIREIKGINNKILFALGYNSPNNSYLLYTTDGGTTWNSFAHGLATLPGAAWYSFTGMAIKSSTEVYISVFTVTQGWTNFYLANISTSTFNTITAPMAEPSILTSLYKISDNIYADAASNLPFQCYQIVTTGGSRSASCIPDDWTAAAFGQLNQIFGNGSKVAILGCSFTTNEVQLSVAEDPGTDTSLWLSSISKADFYHKMENYNALVKYGCMDSSGNVWIACPTWSGNTYMEIAKVTSGSWSYTSLGINPTLADAGAIFVEDNYGCVVFRQDGVHPVTGKSEQVVAYIYNGITWTATDPAPLPNLTTILMPLTTYGYRATITDSPVTIDKIFLIAKDVIRIIFSSAISATYKFWNTNSYSLYNNTLSKNLVIKQVLPVDVKATTILDLNVENITAGENYTLTVNNDLIYDINGLVLFDVNTIFIPQRTKTDSVMSSLPNHYNKKPGSNVRSILEAITIEDEKIGGDF